jgi:hypothetical protein
METMEREAFSPMCLTHTEVLSWRQRAIRGTLWEETTATNQIKMDEDQIFHLKKTQSNWYWTILQTGLSLNTDQMLSYKQ